MSAGSDEAPAGGAAEASGNGTEKHHDSATHRGDAAMSAARPSWHAQACRCRVSAPCMTCARWWRLAREISTRRAWAALTQEWLSS